MTTYQQKCSELIKMSRTDLELCRIFLADPFFMSELSWINTGIFKEPKNTCIKTKIDRLYVKYCVERKRKEEESMNEVARAALDLLKYSHQNKSFAEYLDKNNLTNLLISCGNFDKKTLENPTTRDKVMKLFKIKFKNGSGRTIDDAIAEMKQKEIKDAKEKAEREKAAKEEVAKEEPTLFGQLVIDFFHQDLTAKYLREHPDLRDEFNRENLDNYVLTFLVDVIKFNGLHFGPWAIVLSEFFRRDISEIKDLYDEEDEYDEECYLDPDVYLINTDEHLLKLRNTFKVFLKSCCDVDDLERCEELFKFSSSNLDMRKASQIMTNEYYVIKDKIDVLLSNFIENFDME